MRRLVGLVCLLAACGDDTSSSSGPTVRWSVATFPAPLMVPFPSDLYRDGDGTLIDTLTDWTLAGIENPEPSALFGQYGATNGFGLQSGVIFSVEGIGVADAVDPATLVGKFVLLEAESGMQVPATIGFDAFAKAIVVVPEDTLRSGTTYVAALLAGPALASGPAITASRDFAALRDGTGASPALYADALATVVAKAGVARQDIIAITQYTTASTHEPLRTTATRMFAGAYGSAPPLLTTPAAPFLSTKFGRTAHAGWTATLDAWLGTARKANDGTDLAGAHTGAEAGSYGYPHDAIAAVVTGSIVAPQFPRPFTKTAAYEDGTTAYDADGNAIAFAPTAQVPVMIVLPAGAMPATGFPVVMFQHGLGGDRSTALDIANELARAGMATVAIDAPMHGMRDPGAVDLRSVGTGAYTGPDGLADAGNPLILLEVFGNVRSLLRARDVLWQFALDLISLRRMVDVADLSALADEFGGATPKLDATKVGFIGWSLGGLTGTIFSGITGGDRVDPSILISPASNLNMLFGEAPDYASQSLLLAAAAGVRSQAFDAGRYSVMMNVLEGIFASADTGAFAPLVAAEHNVWLLTGDQDEAVPHASADQLARSLGAKQLTPNVRAAPRVEQVASPLTGAKIAGYYAVSPGNHSHTFERYTTFSYEPPYPRPEEPRFVELPADIKVRQTTVGEQRAIVAFLRSVWAGAPSLSVTDPSFTGLQPVADFDDDGACDADERAAGTDPFDPAVKPAGTGGCVRDLGF